MQGRRMGAECVVCCVGCRGMSSGRAPPSRRATPSADTRCACCMTSTSHIHMHMHTYTQEGIVIAPGRVVTYNACCA